MTDHPPKPRLTLRVGITGHRPNKLPNADLPRIERQLRDTFATIEAAVAKAYEANKAVYADAPADAAGTKPYRIRLISGFAEGADQMAVVACPADWTVEAVLPFPKDEYLKDFAQSAAGDGRDVRHEFETSLKRAAVVTEVPTPRSGLARPGLRRLRRLHAPPDRRAGRGLGRPGAKARRHRRDRAGGVRRRHPRGVDRHRRRTPDRPDRIIPERQAGSHRLQRGANGPCRRRSIRSLRRLRPMRSAIGDRRASGSINSTPRAGAPASWASSFDLLKRWATGQRPLRLVIPSEPLEALEADFNKLVDDAPDAGPLSQRLKDMLAPRYAWADSLAVYFSHLYRNAYVLSYLLAALAVLIAVLGRLCRRAQPGSSCSSAPSWSSSSSSSSSSGTAATTPGTSAGSTTGWSPRACATPAILAYVSEFGLVQQKRIANQPWTIWYIRASLARDSAFPMPSSTGPISARCCNRCCSTRCRRNATGTRPMSTRCTSSTTFCTSWRIAAST